MKVTKLILKCLNVDLCLVVRITTRFICAYLVDDSSLGMDSTLVGIKHNIIK